MGVKRTVSEHGVVQIEDSLVLSPSALTTDADDFNPSGFQDSGDGELLIETMIVSSTTSVDMSGLKAPNPKRRVRVNWINDGGNDITLKNGDTNSSATNRFEGLQDFTIEASMQVPTEYDPTADSGVGRWRIIAAKF